MNAMPHLPSFASRRDFLRLAGGGFGALAFSALLDAEVAAETGKPQAAKADRVLFLFMEGGPSHIDLFDPKPELTKHNGQPLPASFGTGHHADGHRRQQSARQHARNLSKHGQSGIEVSDWLSAHCGAASTILPLCARAGPTG